MIACEDDIKELQYMQKMLVEKYLTDELTKDSLVRITRRISNLAYYVGRETEKYYGGMNND